MALQEPGIFRGSKQASGQTLVVAVVTTVMLVIIWLVVEPTPTPQKNMKVSWDDYSQYMER